MLGRDGDRLAETEPVRFKHTGLRVPYALYERIRGELDGLG